MGRVAVQQWFDNGKDYSSGIALYESFPHNKNILRLLKLKQNPANEEKLEYELSKHIETEPVIVPVKKVQYVAQIIEEKIQLQEKKQSLYFHQLPQELQPELLKANELFKKNCFLKVRLNDLPDEAENEALRLQLEIAENWKGNAVCWQKIDYWLQHKQLPKSDLSGFDKHTPAQLVKSQQYLYQNISKKKKALQSNRQLLSKAELVKDKSRLERLVAKQESYLLKYEEELRIITRIIDGQG